MAVVQDVTSHLTQQLHKLLTPYLPPRDTWNPADEVIYQPRELNRVPLDEAKNMQLKAIKFTFTHHYNNNDFYRKYCEMRNVRPDDIRTVDDLDKIPLIPDTTFKEYPSGENFAHWLATVFSGKLPKIVIKGSNPTYDDVLNAFNAAGLVVTYSSGTSGRHTFIPRDMKTFVAGQYVNVMGSIGFLPPQIPDHVYLLFPNPKKTNLFIGKANLLADSVYKDVQYAVDYEISTESLRRAMTGNREAKGQATSYVQSEALQKMVDQITTWLERYEKTEETIQLSGPPFMLHYIMSKLQKGGTSFDFGERGRVGTAGGWKINEDQRIPHADFRKLVEDVLGIPETHCLDVYGMVEGNAMMLQCPEGHYLHVPYTYYKPFVLDDSLMPAGYGEWGRFAFLDASTQSYPGFIISGDQVRMLEHCPVCDRPGPVLEPEVERAKGEEVRGCAEELRRVLAEDLAS
jgi:long-chain-fatty-acid---luciferin-component ligase